MKSAYPRQPVASLTPFLSRRWARLTSVPTGVRRPASSCQAKPPKWVTNLRSSESMRLHAEHEHVVRAAMTSRRRLNPA